ncbi:MAG: polysaccharide biosynthesis protein, partial [Myxococcales bacterium]|nr:polysaccharide biosynthesis protein [Myxococcales bacterium]
LGNLEAHARNIEIEDLLGRNQVDIDRAPLESFLAGKVVMVTGAGGSIGTEICRQVAQFAPSRLVLVERSEFALFTIERELSQRSPEVEAVAALVDVRDRARLARLYDQHQPAVVIHAAAHKHVPMLEANACEAVINNVVGTKNAAELARDRGVAVFVLVSTDKAVRPTSLMGATKRVAELAVQAVGGATQVVTVRFGNVLGSTGSVVPIFRDQIRRGGPVTVTHPEMERYFMTIAEASQLVLQAGAMGEGGATYILDMGEPVRIVELARDMIRLSGLRVDVDVGIAFTGVRPGEKLREELRYEAETVAPTRHPKILRTRSPRMLDTWVSSYVDELISHARTGDDAAVRRHLARLPGAAITTRREEAHDERPRQRA